MILVNMQRVVEPSPARPGPQVRLRRIDRRMGFTFFADTQQAQTKMNDQPMPVG